MGSVLALLPLVGPVENRVAADDEVQGSMSASVKLQIEPDILPSSA